MVFVLAFMWSIFYWHEADKNDVALIPVGVSDTNGPPASAQPQVQRDEQIDPPPPFDVVLLGDSKDEVAANCKAEDGIPSGPTFYPHLIAGTFVDTCYVNDHYYRVHVPTRQ